MLIKALFSLLLSILFALFSLFFAGEYAPITPAPLPPVPLPSPDIETIFDDTVISLIGKTNAELIESFGPECETELYYGATPVLHYVIDGEWHSFQLVQEPGVDYGSFWPPDYDFTIIDNPYPPDCVIESVWAYSSSILQTEEECTYEYLCALFGQYPEIEFIEDIDRGDFYRAIFTWDGYQLTAISYSDEFSASYWTVLREAGK